MPSEAQGNALAHEGAVDVNHSDAPIEVNRKP